MDSHTHSNLIEGCSKIVENLGRNTNALRMEIEKIKRNQPNDQSLPQLQRLVDKLVQADTEARYTYEQLRNTNVF